MADEQLDTGLQARLRTLADAERKPLPADAQQRVIDHVLSAQQAAPSRSGRVAWAAALAAAAGLLLWLAPGERDAQAPDPQASALPAQAPEGVAPSARDDAMRDGLAGELPARPAAHAEHDAAACPLLAAVRSAGLTPRSDGARALAIDGSLRVVAAAGSDVALGAVEPCSIGIELQHGRVTVQASDLQGGQLRVRSARGDVVVTGTTFAVELSSGQLAVELAEGAVRIERAQAEPLSLQAGQRIELRDSGETRSVLTPAAHAALQRELSPDAHDAHDPHAAADAPAHAGSANARAGTARASAEALLGEADAARKQGDTARARRLYRKAGAQPGATAEAAWLRLARLEMQLDRDAAAGRALDAHRARFASGALAAEAAWMQVQLAQRRGDARATRDAAQRLLKAHPRSPQARAAQRLLDTGGAGEP